MKYYCLDMLKKHYLLRIISTELNLIAKNAQEDCHKKMKRDSLFKRKRTYLASMVVPFILLIIAVNISPAHASTKAPNVVVLTSKEYNVNEERYNAHIKVPQIVGLENKALEESLNEKYLAESKKLYEDFMSEMEEMKKIGAGHLSVDSGFLIKTDTNRLLSIGRYVTIAKGSSSNTVSYDTIDKIDGVLITLPSLFKDERYVDIISENIREQMIEKMNADENLIYWVDNSENNSTVQPFEKISPNQNFYINEKGKLVISFNKYEVAPGFMGIQEFEIPTEVISDILVSNQYIK